MSKISIQNIIKTTLKIDHMTHEQLKACVFELLEKNPILVSKHFLNIEDKKEVQGTDSETETYYIALHNLPASGTTEFNKFIKFISSHHRMNYADAANWLRGHHVVSYHAPGILAGPLTKDSYGISLSNIKNTADVHDIKNINDHLMILSGSAIKQYKYVN